MARRCWPQGTGYLGPAQGVGRGVRSRVLNKAQGCQGGQCPDRSGLSPQGSREPQVKNRKELLPQAQTENRKCSRWPCILGRDTVQGEPSSDSSVTLRGCEVLPQWKGSSLSSSGGLINYFFILQLLPSPDLPPGQLPAILISKYSFLLCFSVPASAVPHAPLLLLSCLYMCRATCCPPGFSGC